MGLRGYLVKRSVNTLILIVFVITLNFVIFEALPGAQGFVAIIQGNPNARPGAVEQAMNHYHLCKEYIAATHHCEPYTAWERFAAYFKNMITFDFGESIQSGKPIMFEIVGNFPNQSRLGNTLLLLGSSTAISLLIGTLLGVFAAAKRGSLFDNGWVTVSLITFSLPTFWMGLLFILVFAQQLAWLPPSGSSPQVWNVPGHLPPLIDQVFIRAEYLFLPALTLTLFFYGGHLLLTRATMTEVLNEDYVVTARAKGLPERSVLFKHALKNAALPLVTNAALSFGGILGGAIITETVFVWNGLGYWLFRSIDWRDLTVMQAMFYLIALSVIAANFVSDIIYGVIDPRIRYD